MKCRTFIASPRRPQCDALHLRPANPQTTRDYPSMGSGCQTRMRGTQGRPPRGGRSPLGLRAGPDMHFYGTANVLGSTRGMGQPCGASSATPFQAASMAFLSCSSGSTPWSQLSKAPSCANLPTMFRNRPYRAHIHIHAHVTSVHSHEGHT